jgi:hypothetical protein
MTVITPASEYANPDEFDPRRDAKLRRRVLEDQQTEALRRRLAERAEPRVRNEEKLASSRSLVEANEPDRVALRLDGATGTGGWRAARTLSFGRSPDIQHVGDGW